MDPSNRPLESEVAVAADEADAAGTAAATSELPTPAAPVVRKSPGFWKSAWREFRKNKLAMLALAFVVFLAVVAVLSPAIAGTKPVAVKYKGDWYFPAMAYFNPDWENPVFQKDRFRKRYGTNLPKKDPDHVAYWPLVLQDPLRPVRRGEFPDDAGNPTGRDGSPSARNLFGTTSAGKDVFAQMVHGARISLLVGFVSMGIATVIGMTLGAVAGYSGGVVDWVISRFIEIALCIPTLVLILALIAVIEKVTVWHLMAVIGVTGWTGIARLTRAEFLKHRESDFVAAARVTGVSTPRIIFRYILPNAVAPVLVPITFGIAGAILIESALSYLGFGPPPPTPSWGRLLKEGKEDYTLWWLTVFPGIAIFAAVLAYNLIGEGLQDATDPRLRERGE